MRELLGVPPSRTSLNQGDEEDRESGSGLDPSLAPLPPGTVRVTVVHNGREREEVVDAIELAHLQAQQRAALAELRRSEDMFTVPEWVRLHPLLGSYMAEAIGTFAWVLTVALSKSSMQSNIFTLESTSSMDMLPTGLVLAAMIFAMGYISGGHFNPAVSLAVFLIRKMELSLFISFIVIQLVAGMGAGFVAMLILDDTDIFVPSVDSGYISSGVFSELIFTLAIGLVVLNTRYSRQSSNFYYAMAVGMTVSAGSASAGRISGGSFNPAAATGLQAAKCFSGDCAAIKVFWVYWVAPLIGAAVAAMLYAQMDQPLEGNRLLEDEMVIPVQVPEEVREHRRIQAELAKAAATRQQQRAQAAARRRREARARRDGGGSSEGGGSDATRGFAGGERSGLASWRSSALRVDRHKDSATTPRSHTVRFMEADGFPNKEEEKVDENREEVVHKTSAMEEVLRQYAHVEEENRKESHRPPPIIAENGVGEV